MFGKIMGATRGKSPSNQYIPMFIAEVIGTGMLTFFGCMGCLVQNETTPHFLAGFSFGFTVMMIIQIFGHISGAHLNSCVTLGRLLLGYMKPMMAAVYIVAQLVGAILGYGLLKALVADVQDGLCVTTLKLNVSIWQGFILEFMISTVLVLVCCAVWDPRNGHNSDSVALRFGLVVGVIAVVVGPYTGGSMNTARSLGPAVWNTNWEHHWIYWVAPNLSSFFAVGIYRFFWTPFPDNEASNEEEKV